MISVQARSNFINVSFVLFLGDTTIESVTDCHKTVALTTRLQRLITALGTETMEPYTIYCFLYILD